MPDTLPTIRKRTGLLQTDIAQALGVGQTAVSMWETGNAYPHATILPKLARLLNCGEGDIIEAITTARQARKTPPAGQTA